MRTVIRIQAFVRKEIVDVVRQPRLVLALVVGPFIILLVFGAGLRDVDPPQDVVIVTPTDERVRAQVEEFVAAQEDREQLVVDDVTDDREAALGRLSRGEIDVVLVFPDGATEQILDDEQATIAMYHSQIDPIEQQALVLFAGSAIDEVNRLVLEQVVIEGQGDAEVLRERVADARERTRALAQAREAGDDAELGRETDLLRSDLELLALGVGSSAAALGAFGGQDLTGMTEPTEDGNGSGFAQLGEDPSAEDLAVLDEDLARLDEHLATFETMTPRVLVRPFNAEVRLVGTESTELTTFYTPAAVIILLQHLVVTFFALSVVRERELGTSELFTVAPLRPFELVSGKLIAYLVLGGVVAAGLLSLSVLGLGVPMHGAWLDLVASILVVLLASSALGLVIAYLSGSDSQAVQFSMLVLLATIFLSGFLLSLERFLPFARPIAWVLPATYGNQLVRDVMLRGAPVDPLVLAGAGAYAAVLIIVGGVLAHRRMTPAR